MELKKAQDPKIDVNDPWANDDLQRKREGDLLTRLIQSLNGSYVIAVKGNWGSGKSVFLRRLSANLEQVSIPVITVDAWRTDYLEDPLIAFVAATEQRISDQRTHSEKRIEKGKGITKKLAKYAAKLSPPLAGTIADTIAPGAGPPTQAAAETLERAGEIVLDAIKTRKEAETRFREQLSEARDHLTKRQKMRPVRPIVVMLDELDRCRPSYAVKVLERIKHYFDVPGIVFVIATDGENLPNAVASVYGDKINGERYLRKFFDYEFDLQDPDPEHFVHALVDQFEFNQLIDSSQYDKPALSGFISNPSNGAYSTAIDARDRGLDALEIVEAFPFFAKKLNLTLRDQAQAFTLINAYLRTLSPKVVAYPALLVLIYCLRFSNAQLFHRLRVGEIDVYALFNRVSANTPLLQGADSWIMENSFAREILLFSTASREAKPEDYIHNVRLNAHQSDNQRRNINPADRLYFRIRSDSGDIKDFLSRAFKLADAFA